MIIKELKLENIRSHEATVIVFSEGKTLIQGDIGSGKSIIMMSIEEALFGIDANKATIIQDKTVSKNPCLIDIFFWLANS